VCDFLSKKLPRDHDSELMKIQSAVLACVCPLTSAWQALLVADFDTTELLQVTVEGVFSMIQWCICLIGIASEYISVVRRSKILVQIDLSCAKFGLDEYGSSAVLFGDEFAGMLWHFSP
jgi:hypothetical protein